ncbi:hypothetical protein [Thalassolituus hydrocarboniclasticus]|jgi:hypothetical protein|uniref:Bor family protein n=1 Tax=Thalassolituus hydrocarboniclasticus TaxID=2742796 RepID=A0ABY6A5H9_9GAMM|nr:hypothetical protein [Thalassolituus hydrocarboniclasticus]UXD86316.1 hypothetical protein HUF19_02115 [Thalassolituus hydrocarboniclasticus]
MAERRIIRAVAVIACALLSACSTIHFSHELSSSRQPAPPLPVKWHDTTIDGMIEISPPVNLYRECKGKPWSKVTVEYSFSNGLVTALVGGTLASVAPVFDWVSLYSPWSVETRCSQPLEP